MAKTRKLRRETYCSPKSYFMLRYGQSEELEERDRNSCSRNIKNSGFANLEQGTSCHVKTHTECVYRICILSLANEMGNSESVSDSHVI